MHKYPQSDSHAKLSCMEISLIKKVIKDKSNKFLYTISGLFLSFMSMFNMYMSIFSIHQVSGDTHTFVGQTINVCCEIQDI